MDLKNKTIFIFINTLLISVSGSFAQDGDFQKMLIRETMKGTMKDMMKDMMKPQIIKSDSLINVLDKKTVRLEVDPAKIKIPIYSSFNHQLDSFKNTAWAEMIEKEKILEKDALIINPNALLNYKVSFDANYDKTPIFNDGNWIPASAGFGINPMILFDFLFKSGIVKYDPLPFTKSKKEKNLERLREIYGREEDEWKEKSKPEKLNEKINLLIGQTKKQKK